MASKAKNNNIERNRIRAREEIANAALRMREAADDARLFLSEGGILSGQIFILERAVKNARGASSALNWAHEQLGQLPLKDFIEEGGEE